MNVVNDEAALSLSMSGGSVGNYVVVQIADGKTFDIGTNLNAGDDYNYIILGDQSHLNTGTGAGAIAVLSTDAASTGATTLKNEGNVSVGFFVDGWEAGAPERTFIKKGGGTLALDNVVGTVDAAHTTFQIEQGTLTVRGPDPLGGSAAAIKLAGGNLSITGEVVVTYSAGGADVLRHYAWMNDWGVADEVHGDFNNNGGLVAMTSTAVGSHLYDHGPIGTGIEMQNDGHFRTAMPEITRNDYFQNLWLGELSWAAPLCLMIALLSGFVYWV